MTARRDDRTVPFTVIVCTRGRRDQLHRTLDALERQEGVEFDIIIIDQSDHADPTLERRAAESIRVSVIHDTGRGLSRARNIGWRATDSEWVAFVDDDCLPDPDWASELRTAIAEHPEASLISGDVRAEADYPPSSVLVAVSRVTEERLIDGSRTRPDAIGLGVCMALNRQAIADLGGFDERFGPGVSPFPAADDMDFNYRFLRAGGMAYVTPRMRAVHEQWRSPREVITLFSGYRRAYAAFTMKHLRSGDLRGGMWLWWIGLRDAPGMLRSAVRFRSMLRLRMAVAILAGIATGTIRGAVWRW